MTTVGLDMSLTSTGVCIINDGENQERSVLVKTIKTTPKTADNDLLRLKFIVDSCIDLIPNQVDMICIEDFFIPASKMQFNSAIKLVQLGTLMRVRLLDCGYSFYIPVAGQLKKFATGKGRCEKSIVVREVYKKWGVEVTDDNQADACTLAYMASAIVGGEKELTKYQEQVINKVKEERPSYNI